MSLKAVHSRFDPIVAAMEARFSHGAPARLTTDPDVGLLPAAARLTTDPDVGLLLSPLVTRGTIEEVSRGQPVVRADLGGLRWLDESALRQAPRVCGAALRELVLDRCPAASDAVLRQAASSCAQLTTLSLRGCPRVTLAGVNHVMRHCAALRALDLSCNPAFLDAPAPARDEDLVQLYHRSVPKDLRPAVTIRTTADGHDPAAEATRQVRLFCRLFTARSLAVLELQDVRGVDDSLIKLLCEPPRLGDTVTAEDEEYDNYLGAGEGTADADSAAAVAAVAATTTTSAMANTVANVKTALTGGAFEPGAEGTQGAYGAHGRHDIYGGHGAHGAAALKRVNLAGTDVGDRGLRILAAASPELEDVSVAMTRVGPSGVHALAEHCGELAHVDLAGLALDDACVAELLLNQAGLRTLSLAGCSGVIMSLSQVDLAQSVIERIDLTACPAVRAHGLAALLRAPRLHSVVLNACYQLDRAALDELNAQGRARTPHIAFTRAKDRAPGDALSSGLVDGWRPSTTLRAVAREGGGGKRSSSKK
jgi:hypothetical protein